MADDFSYEIVWQRVGEDLARELVDFWLANQALPSRAAAIARTKEVAAIARDAGGALAGVASLETRYFPQLRNEFFFYRTFSAPAHRRHGLALHLVFRVVPFLEAEFAAGRTGKSIGVVVIGDNRELQELVNFAVTPVLPFVFIGVDRQGRHVRVHYFENARIGPSVGVTDKTVEETQSIYAEALEFAERRRRGE